MLMAGGKPLRAEGRATMRDTRMSDHPPPPAPGRMITDGRMIKGGAPPKAGIKAISNMNALCMGSCGAC
eukprot:3793173-Karenia_brevis.AAC.1